MVESDHPDVSITRQCKLLVDLALMRLIDQQFLETPFFGVRQMTWHLRNDGHQVNVKRIRRLMRRGFLYLVVIMDWHTRKVPAWRISNIEPWSATGPRIMARKADFCVEALNEAVFVPDALEQAVHDRRPENGMVLVHHGDRGSQYLSIRDTERLAEAGIEPSVASVGDSYDNALMETINGLCKAEVIRRRGS